MNRLVAAVRNLFRRDAVDKDTDAELRSYLAVAIEDGERRGLSRKEAERAARAEFGSIGSVRDGVRDVQSGAWLGTVWRDGVYAIRTLGRSKGFTAAVVGVLAIGIGANTAIFSLVNGVLLRPIPLDDGSRLVRLFHTPPQTSFPGVTIFAVSPANYLDWKAQSRVFEDLAAYAVSDMTLTGGDQAEGLRVAVVDPALFGIVRARPAMGRVLLPEENQPGHESVAVVSMGFWRGHFGDASLADQTITLNQKRFAIVGVMPASFEWPSWTITSSPVWIPLAWTSDERAVRDNHNYQVTGRLKPGVSLAEANADITRVSANLARAYPKEDTGWGATVVDLQALVVGDSRTSLFVLVGAVLFVLLIASANAANLMLGRALGRRKEIAIRTALGASRRRIIQQVLIETLVVGVAAGLCGIALAYLALSAFRTVLADQLPRAAEVTLEWRVLAFTLTISIVTAVVTGLVPALTVSRARLQHALKQGLGRTDATATGRRGRALLVGAEVAFSLVLLVGAGLMIRSLQALSRLDLGFDPSHVATMMIRIPNAKYATPASRSQFFDDALARIRALPDVRAAAFIDDVPIEGGSIQPFNIVGRPPAAAADALAIAVREASPGYLDTMRIPLLRGRDFDAHDPHAVLVSASAARTFWPGADPIGQHLQFPFTPGVTWDVIGVVGDVKLNGLDSTGQTAGAYQWQAERPWTFGIFVARTNGSPETAAGPLRRVIRDVDPDQSVRSVSTMDETIAATTASRRFEEKILAVFAVVALLLAAMGLYSVLAHAVRGRAKEIAVRTALGASAADVIQMVAAEGTMPTLGGIAVGLVGIALLVPTLRTLVFGIGAFDPLTVASVAGLLLVVAALAGLAPAYRAVRLDPVRVLRDD